MIERSRQLFKERGELVVLYFNFVRYSKIEEIYGWEKLDAVLETTASAVREFLDDDDLRASRVMVSFTNDDDFIFFHVPASRRGRGDGRRDHRDGDAAAAPRRRDGSRRRTARRSRRCSTSTSAARTCTTTRRFGSSD